MQLSKIAGTAVVLILGMSMPVYGQKDEKEQAQPHAQPAQQAKPQQQRAAPQAQQRAAPQAQERAQPQQSKAPAAQPQQHTQQAKSPAAQPQQHTQQAKAPAAQPQQHTQQAKSPAQQPQERAQQAKPSPLAQHAQPAAAQQARAPQARPRPAVAARVQTPQVQRTPKQAQSWQQQRGWDKQGGGWQPHTNFQQGRDQNWASDHRDWAQRGGYGGSYIPQATFGLYFGSAHFFHIGVMPVMYMGYPRFAYGGFSFMLLDPWPGSWQENWYASDSVYIDYSDGYYLHDLRYPGVSLAVTVAL